MGETSFNACSRLCAAFCIACSLTPCCAAINCSAICFTSSCCLPNCGSVGVPCGGGVFCSPCAPSIPSCAFCIAATASFKLLAPNCCAACCAACCASEVFFEGELLPVSASASAIACCCFCRFSSNPGGVLAICDCASLTSCCAFSSAAAASARLFSGSFCIPNSSRSSFIFV